MHKYIVFVLKENEMVGYVAPDRRNIEFQAMECGRFSEKEVSDVVKEWTKPPQQQAFSMAIWDTYSCKSHFATVKNGKSYINIFM